jgi:hypothetical protein
MPSPPRLLAFASFVMLLGACQRTVFESPPAAAAACDPALAGRWLSLGDRAEERGELEANIDAACGLVTIERKQAGPQRSTPTTLRHARVDGMNYLWVDAAWVHRNFEVEAGVLDRPGDVYLYAWRLRGDQLLLSAPPHRALAHHVLDKDIKGDVLMQDEDLTIRVRGDAAATRAMLRKHRLFRFDEPLRFERAAADAAR